MEENEGIGKDRRFKEEGTLEMSINRRAIPSVKVETKCMDGSWGELSILGDTSTGCMQMKTL